MFKMLQIQQSVHFTVKIVISNINIAADFNLLGYGGYMIGSMAEW